GCLGGADEARRRFRLEVDLATLDGPFDHAGREQPVQLAARRAGARPGEPSDLPQVPALSGLAGEEIEDPLADPRPPGQSGGSHVLRHEYMCTRSANGSQG